MYEDKAPPDLRRGTREKAGTGGGGRPAPFNWKALPAETLIEYYDAIKRCLPPLTLKETDLEEEMLLQFHTLRTLQSTVLTDDELPLNQRVQAANAVGSVLGKLGDMQIDIYTSERFKAIENILIRVLRELPEAQVIEFLKRYEALLEGLKK